MFTIFLSTISMSDRMWISFVVSTGAYKVCRTLGKIKVCRGVFWIGRYMLGCLSRDFLVDKR